MSSSSSGLSSVPGTSSSPGPSSDPPHPPNPAPNPAPTQAFTLHPATAGLLDGLRNGHVDLPDAELRRPGSPGESSISEYMKNLDIPSKFEVVPVDKYMNFAITVANKIDNRSRAQAEQILDPKLMSSEDKVLFVENEAGVFAYNERHFMRVCDACIKACWSDIGNNADTWFCRTVESNFPTNEKWPSPNQDQKFHIKPDGAWFRVSEGRTPKYSSDHTRCVSVYELKSTDIIYMSCKTLRPIVQHIPRSGTRRLREGGEYSANRARQLTEPAEKLVKQAAAYAIGFRTQHVAMYDYSTLLLIRFVDFETSTTLTITEAFSKGGVGNKYEITMVTDRNKMVPALTGFLYEAQQEETGLGMPSGATATQTA